MIYDVDYDEGNTFTIYWRKSVANAFFDFRTPIYHYRITVADMGIIGYMVQQICCGDMGGDVQQDTIHGSVFLIARYVFTHGEPPSAAVRRTWRV
ncbi:hypothetical protein D3Z45_18045 [Lachnospiraceae bacterium]|nr:hypothetical protein [Lachnospiraceae bacterium]